MTICAYILDSSQTSRGFRPLVSGFLRRYPPISLGSIQTVMAGHGDQKALQKRPPFHGSCLAEGCHLCSAFGLSATKKYFAWLFFEWMQFKIGSYDRSRRLFDLWNHCRSDSMESTRCLLRWQTTLAETTMIEVGSPRENLKPLTREPDEQWTLI